MILYEISCVFNQKEFSYVITSDLNKLIFGIDESEPENLKWNVDAFDIIMI